MNIRSLETREPDQFEIIFGDIPAIFVRQIGLQLQTEKHVAENIQPRKKRWFLEHHQAISSRAGYRLSIGEHISAVRLFQSSNDVQQCRFPAAARADEADKLTFVYLQTHMVERQDSA